MKRRRPLLLWACVLWLLALGIIDLWRSTTLWQTRSLLMELGGSLTPFTLTLWVVGWGITAAGLIAAAVGLWFRADWARHVARPAMVAHYAWFQAYVWRFVQTGLLWERRWSSLVVAALAVTLGLLALTWSRTRRWLGLSNKQNLS